jgi:hypothetical protein
MIRKKLTGGDKLVFIVAEAPMSGPAQINKEDQEIINILSNQFDCFHHPILGREL